MVLRAEESPKPQAEVDDALWARRSQNMTSSSLTPPPQPPPKMQLPVSHSDSPNSVRGKVSGTNAAERKLIRAPFYRTIRYDLLGPNVAILASPFGHLYWGTDDTPTPPLEVQRRDAFDAPPDAATAMAELGARPANCSLWVLRGCVLDSSVTPPKDMHCETVARCRTGFVSDSELCGRPPYSGVLASKLHRRVKRLHHVLLAGGGTALGLRPNMNDGKFHFSLRKITAFLTCSPDMLAALIADNPVVASCFSGKISYAARYADDAPPDGIIYLTQPIPAGRWLTGRFIDTKIGLLARGEQDYFRVVNNNNVSRLVRVLPEDYDINTWQHTEIHIADFIE